MRYRNTGGRRVWPTLTDEQTGRTLELDAGEEADLAAEVDDPYLEPVSAPEPAVQVDLHAAPVETAATG